MFRIHTLAVSSLLCAVACTGGPLSTEPTGPPSGAGPDRPSAPGEQAAVTLGMTVLSRDGSGAPRLIRSIVPRVRPAGMTLQAAARDHVAALAPLWVGRAAPMALTELGTERLRNGAKGGPDANLQFRVRIIEPGHGVSLPSVAYTNNGAVCEVALSVSERSSVIE